MPTWLYPSGFRYWDEAEQAAIARVITSDWYTYGPETEAFEAEIAAYHGRKYAVAVNSGSSANLVAVTAMCYTQDKPLRRGDLTIVPSIAWATTWAPLITAGFDLIVADCDDTWNVPPTYTSTASIVPRRSDPRLIVSCPVLGNPAHGAGWRRIADALGARLIEDACESLGAVDAAGRLVGTHGDISTLSFFMSHQIAGIEGGACLTDDLELYRLCKLVRNHGWTRDVMKATNFEDEYNFIVPGMNLRPLEINMAVSREQLRKLPKFMEMRRHNLAIFTDQAQFLPITPQRTEGHPSPFGLAFTVDDGKAARARLATALRATGIDCRLPTGGSFTRHPIGKPWSNQPTPNADSIHDTGMFIGNAPYPIEDLIDLAVDVMRETL